MCATSACSDPEYTSKLETAFLAEADAVTAVQTARPLMLIAV